jgi:membrane-associated phospholipid phosphatase
MVYNEPQGCRWPYSGVKNLGEAMRTQFAAWMGSAMIAFVVTLATRYCAYFPGDVAVERWVQSVFLVNLDWAREVSRTAEFPWILLILAVVFTSSRALAGWRASLLSIVSLVGMLALGKWLGPIIGRPRPSPELVHVVRPLSGFSFPSLFGLRYSATFGFLAVLSAGKRSGTLGAILLIVCGVLLIVGWVARVALAAHWPSDVIISYYLGLLWAAFLIRFGPIVLGPFKTSESSRVPGGSEG